MGDDRHLIVASLPGGDDTYYYKDSLQDIVEFLKELDVKTAGNDELIVLHENNSKLLNGIEFTHAKCLPLDKPLDLWMRDFTPVIPSLQVQFRYKPSYLNTKDANWVSGNFELFLRDMKPSAGTTKSTIILDGGNVVDNDLDKAVITKRLLTDNKQTTEDCILEQMEKLLKKDICVIPDLGDTTGHSDGLVSFIEDNTLLLADYGNEDEYKNLETILKSRFPHITIVRLPCKDTGKVWKGVSSAIGSYVNCLVTSNCVYVPRFGESNDHVLSIIRRDTLKKVLTIDTGKLSNMGGSVRCMTWQIHCSHPIAECLCQLATKHRH